MKRWRDYGEVQDSDEEDISLGAESQSSDGRRKRPRTDENGGSQNIAASAQKEHTTISEPQQSLTEFVATESDFANGDGQTGERDTASDPVATKDCDLVPDGSNDADGDVPWLSERSAKVYGRKTRILHEVAPEHVESSKPTSTDSSTADEPATTTKSLLSVVIPKFTQSPSISGSTPEEDRLPSPHELLQKALPRLQTNIAQDHSANLATLSSPLSDPPESPLRVERDFAATNGASPGLANANSVTIQEPQLVYPTPGAVRRNLRARQEKQLHPYLYDKTMYQKQCKERGVRPVRVAEQRDAETQDASLSRDGDGTEDPSQPSEHSLHENENFGDETASLSDLEVTHQRAETFGDDDELPDVSTFLKRGVYKRSLDTSKRRKLFHPSANNQSRGRLQRIRRDQGDELLVPPSPPSSAGLPAVEADKSGRSNFKFPRGLSPALRSALLPTPDISSEARPSFGRGSQDPSDDGLPTRRLGTSSVFRLQSRAMLINSTSESESESEPEPHSSINNARLDREKRRIRGVLPASWLKIDLKSRKVQDSPLPEINTTSPKSAKQPQRGVARRILSRDINTDRTAAGGMEISDDSDTHSNDIEMLSRAVSPQQTRLQLMPEGLSMLPDMDDVDEMESDFIDPMLTGASRKRPQKALTMGKGRKQQPRITEAFREREATEPDRPSHPQLPHERAAVSSATAVAGRRPKGNARKRATKPKAPRLSILDAPRSPSSKHEDMPQFVRLAARQARKTANKGRHSPSAKVIRLATERDTEEAVGVLRSWQKGSLAPSSEWREQIDGFTMQDHNVEDYAANDTTRQPLADMAPNRQSTNHSTRSEAKELGLASRLRPVPRTMTPVVRQPKSRGAQSPENLNQAHGLNSQGPKQSAKPRPLHRARSLHMYRGAQLEATEQDFYGQNRAAAFEQRLISLTEPARKHRSANAPLPDIERFMRQSEQTFRPASPTAQLYEQPTADVAGRRSTKKSAVPHRPRKGKPRRVDIEARIYRQPSEPLPESTEQPVELEDTHVEEQPVLNGLSQWGSRYAVDSDIRPLPAGTYFHQSTFIGSGEFAETLTLSGRDLEIPAGRVRVHVDGTVFEWSAWTEEVGDEMTRIPDAVTIAARTASGLEDEQERREQIAIVRSNIEHMLRSVTRYLAKCVHFIDPIDRRSLIQRLQRLGEDLEGVAGEISLWQGGMAVVRRLTLQYTLVLAAQTLKIARHHLVSQQVQSGCYDKLKYVGFTMAALAIADETAALRNCYEDMMYASKRELGIRNDESAISSLVLLRCVLDMADPLKPLLWDILEKCWCPNTASLQSVSAFDTVWRKIFTVLPALQFDASGILSPLGCVSNNENWSLPKMLMERLLHLYPATSNMRSSTLNDYVRATLARCSRLITTWGWYRCESLLGTVFDFFARRGLSMLSNEENTGTPTFVDNLADGPDLTVRLGDQSFHMFLKMLAAALQGMQNNELYTLKKIGSIAWRFIPNHSRLLSKDAEVRQADLDALRNQFDLLCTLYFSSPPQHRLKVYLLRDIIDQSTSHREACRISIRSWANLASFQVSTDEPVGSLEPFNAWLKGIVQTTMLQYRLARTEAEQAFAHAKAQGSGTITEQLLEQTIASNQRQIAATLVDALAALKRAISSANGLPAAVYLVKHSEFSKVLDLYAPSDRRLKGVLDECLEVLQVALQLRPKPCRKPESQTSSEESQDYGDFSALQEFALTQAGAGEAETVAEELSTTLYDITSQILSNVFGTETASDDAILAKVVDIWVQLASSLVHAGTRSWNTFIDDYSSSVWSQLRDTDHRRKFTPYFLARIIEVCQRTGELPMESIIVSWLRSLMERESTLKYQHRLTSALLNSREDTTLLRNLPFAKRKGSDEYDISLDELRQRRLNLLSSVLSNIHDDVEEHAQSRTRYQELRRSYANTIRQLMQAMKSNYQEVQSSRTTDDVAVSAQGAYVVFVQQVVSFLQQYTADVCPVDRFFTDSTAFPLPATDPTYVVGRLKGYALRLGDSRARKQLSVFIHTVSERAAVDSQQAYLVDQLHTTTTGSYEHGDSQKPSLRNVILTAIFPAYIEQTLSTACGWIPAVPIIETAASIVKEMVYDFDARDTQSLAATMVIIESVTKSCHLAIRPAFQHPESLGLPHVQKVLAVVLETCTSCLALCEYIQRSAPEIHRPVSKFRRPAPYIRTFRRAAQEIIDHSSSGFEPYLLDLDMPSQPTSDPWQDTREFSARQHRESLARDWYARDGQYFVKRGNASKEVVAPLDIDGAEQKRMLKAAEDFCADYDRLYGRGYGRHEPETDYCGMGSLVV